MIKVGDEVTAARILRSVKDPRKSVYLCFADADADDPPEVAADNAFIVGGELALLDVFITTDRNVNPFHLDPRNAPAAVFGFDDTYYALTQAQAQDENHVRKKIKKAQRETKIEP